MGFERNLLLFSNPVLKFPSKPYLENLPNLDCLAYLMVQKAHMIFLPLHNTTQHNTTDF